MQLTTTNTKDGILCEHSVYGLVATITWSTHRHCWVILSDSPRAAMSGMEFHSLKSAEYAALIIAHELEATGH